MEIKLKPEPFARVAARITLLLACVLLFVNDSPARVPKKSAAKAAAVAKGKSWYFAVSGDSRDCGDLILPKIAWSIEQGRKTTPAAFYWHLGDLRALYRIDCDMLLRRDPTAKCPLEPNKGTEKYPFGLYLEEAWDDYIERQINPFGATPFFIGIGNHELINRPRDYFQCKFDKWLTQEPLSTQLKADAKRGVPSNASGVFYHFIKDGVDFIYLDNSGSDASFSGEQLAWLAKVLALDADDKKVKTIVVGMHAALPLSNERGHAMDTSCPGICSGLRAYDLLQRAQNLGASPDRRKHVYVFASHSHFFRENIYDSPEHKGKVLPGWIIGTGGAEQYKKDMSEPIMYGYMQVEVRADGTIATQFKEVTRQTPPLATGPEADSLNTYCFEQNKRPPRDDNKTGCKCEP
jgi:hypothetical protein